MQHKIKRYGVVNLEGCFDWLSSASWHFFRTTSYFIYDKTWSFCIFLSNCS